LRLVKKTVNVDDPSVYHLYYGDNTGSPGSIITFFPSKHFSQGEPDQGQAVAVSFSIPPQAVTFWTERITKAGIDFIEPFTRFGKEVIGLQDPDGLHLELIADPKAEKSDGRKYNSIPSEYSIRGLHGVTLAEENHETTGKLLTDSLGFEVTGKEHDRIRYKSGSAFGSVIEIIDGAGLNGRSGKGTVHHVAFRAKDDDQQMKIRRELVEKGYHVTEVKDRLYFRSIYFHEPGGVLFEVATDLPGFTADEPVESLGKNLKLPPRLEDRRDLIEVDLSNLDINS